MKQHIRIAMALGLAHAVACDDAGSTDACGEGFVLVDDTCVVDVDNPGDGDASVGDGDVGDGDVGDGDVGDGDVGDGDVDAGDGDVGDGDVGDGDGDVGDGDAGVDAGDGRVNLPFKVDDHFVAAGYMGHTAGIERTECGEDALSENPAHCHHFAWTPGGAGWGGVHWLHPFNNWEDPSKGLPVEAGATRISFWAWGDVGGEKVKFTAGTVLDTHRLPEVEFTLTDEPTQYFLDMEGKTYDRVMSGFTWVGGGPAAFGFYVDGVEWQRVDDAGDGGVPDASVDDAGVQEPDASTSEPDASTPEPDAGVPEPDASTPELDASTPDLDASTPELDASTEEPDASTPELDASTPEPDAGTSPDDAGVEDDAGTDGGTDPEPTFPPVVVDDHYEVTGFMGSSNAEVVDYEEGDCPAPRPGEARGACHRFSWASAGGWAGVYWQAPAGNWGPMPGYDMPEGASRVSFYAWGDEGGEVLHFDVGMDHTGADGFKRSTGDITLTTTPTRYTIDLTGVTYTSVRGGFAWASGQGGTITFYVDDIVWE